MTKFVKDSNKKVMYGNDGELDVTENTYQVNSIIDKMERGYPEMMGEFRKIQEEQYELFAVKQHSYGPNNISVGTQLKTDADIKLSLTGLFFRMNDKIERIKTMIMKCVENKDEPLEDSFLDLSVYGVIAEIVRRKKWGK